MAIWNQDFAREFAARIGTGDLHNKPKPRERYAVVRLAGTARRSSYTIGRVLEIDGATYVRFEPQYQPGECGYAYAHKLFGNKADAFKAARGLGDALPEIQVRDYLPAHIEAVKRDDAKVRKDLLK